MSQTQDIKDYCMEKAKIHLDIAFKNIANLNTKIFEYEMGKAETYREVTKYIQEYEKSQRHYKD